MSCEEYGRLYKQGKKEQMQYDSRQRNESVSLRIADERWHAEVQRRIRDEGV